MPTGFDMDWPNSRRRASFIERPWHLALSSDDLRAILAQNGIETVLIGAHAANRYRLEARQTVDVDFLASSLVGAAEALRAAGCTVREVREDGTTYLLSARIGATVDDSYVEQVAQQWGVADHWQEIRAEP